MHPINMLISWHGEKSSCVQVGLSHIIQNANTTLSYPYLWTPPLHHFLGLDTCYWLYKEWPKKKKKKILIKSDSRQLFLPRKINCSTLHSNYLKLMEKMFYIFSSWFGKLLGQNISKLEMRWSCKSGWKVY